MKKELREGCLPLFMALLGIASAILAVISINKASVLVLPATILCGISCAYFVGGITDHIMGKDNKRQRKP